jgi:hypothetical protein
VYAQSGWFAVWWYGRPGGIGKMSNVFMRYMPEWHNT